MKTYFIQLAISIILLVYALGSILTLSDVSVAHLLDPIFVKVVFCGAVLLIFNRKYYWPSNFIVVSVVLFIIQFMFYYNSKYPDAVTSSYGFAVAVLPLFYGGLIASIGSAIIFIKMKRKNCV